MFVPTCLGLPVLSFAWIGIKNSPGLIVFTVLYGFFSGTFLTFPFSTVVRLSPHMGVVGVRMGVACAVVSLGLLVGTPVEEPSWNTDGRLFRHLVVLCSWSPPLRLQPLGLRRVVGSSGLILSLTLRFMLSAAAFIFSTKVVIFSFPFH